MPLLSLEHSRLAYRADFAVYGAASLGLGVFLALAVPTEQRGMGLALALAGLASWTLMEYALHRFVLHGLRPFSRWHAAHHHRPRALICAPTILSAALIVLLVQLPAVLLGGRWLGSAYTLGVVTGYLAYAITHHATHHWRARSAWAQQRKVWHALHHRPAGPPGHFGVTGNFWDRVFRTT
jgi:cyclopropane-fatty-acyl-phospholipid synthase